LKIDKLPKTHRKLVEFIAQKSVILYYFCV